MHAPGTLHINGDPVGLRQLIDNLVRNGVRHGSARVELHLGATHDSAVLDVDDDGPGSDGVHRRVVFEPFVRLDDATRRRDGGAGLGLAIVHAVADRHGGNVAVSESQLGGARFRVLLPRRATGIAADGASTTDGDGPATTRASRSPGAPRRRSPRRRAG